MSASFPSCLGARRFRTARGFTVVELLVATAITIVMIVILMQVATSLLGVWNRTSGTLSAGNQARLALDYLARDLASAALQRDGNPWLVATIQGNQAAATGDSGMASAVWVRGGENPKPDNDDSYTRDANTIIPSLVLSAPTRRIEDYRFGQAGVWLRFFTTDLDTNNGTPDNLSTIRAVSYQLIRRFEGPSVTRDLRRYQLFRSVVSPTNTFNTGFDLDAAGYNTGLATDGVPGNVRRPNASRILANHVIDFGVRFYCRNTAGALVPFFPDPPAGTQTYDETGAPIAVTAPVTAFVANAGTPVGNIAIGNLARAMPESAEVMLRILTDEGARLIEAIELGRVAQPAEFTTFAEWWWSVADAHSQVFTRRIEIKARSP